MFDVSSTQLKVKDAATETNSVTKARLWMWWSCSQDINKTSFILGTSQNMSLRLSCCCWGKNGRFCRLEQEVGGEEGRVPWTMMVVMFSPLLWHDIILCLQSLAELLLNSLVVDWYDMLQCRLQYASPVLSHGSSCQSPAHPEQVFTVWCESHAADQGVGRGQGRLHGESDCCWCGDDEDKHWITDCLHYTRW